MKRKLVNFTSFLNKKLFRSRRNQVSPLLFLAFKSKFPKAKNVDWQRIDVFKWHVNFTLKKKKHTALFNNEGRWLETVSEVPLKKIPKPVQLNFEVEYGKDSIQQIYHVQTPDRNLYEMKLHNGINVLQILYDISGKTVGKLIL